MIRRYSKTNDLAIKVDIDLNNIESIEISYFTDGEYKYTVTEIDQTDTGLYIYIPSQELQKMNDGILYSQIKYYLICTNYPDSKYNEIKKQSLDIWIR